MTPLTINASSTGQTLTFQWFTGEIGDTSRPIATTPQVNVAPLTSTSYWVLVRSGCGATATGVVSISVRPCTRPAVLIQPAGS